MNYEECMLAVLANPESDAPRRDLAVALRGADPARAEFIERQLDMAIRNRSTKYHPGVATIGRVSCEEDSLLQTHERRWSEDLSFFLGETLAQRNVEFHRGLPWLCSMNPYMLLEKGDYIVSRVAPLRGIEFFPDPEGAPFPVEDIAASPLLERFEEIRFLPGALGKNQLEVFAASTHLLRLRALDFRLNWVSVEAWEALAANALTRQCLSIRTDYEVPSDGGPIRECSARFDIYPDRYFEMSAEGKALERAHGYIPWLHDENVCYPPDAHYWVDNKVLPLFAPGSACDAPTPYGSGLWKPVDREPRARFDKRDFDAVY